MEIFGLISLHIKMADGNSSPCTTNEANCALSETLFDKTNECSATKCPNLVFDGIIYRWKGNLTELKSYFENDLKLHGTWSSPGGEAKVFKSYEDLSVKWHGRKSKKIVIVKDNDEGQLPKLFQEHAHNVLLNYNDNYNDKQEQAKDMQTSLNNASDKTDVRVKTVNDRFTELHLRIQNIEGKLLCKVNLVMDELYELKSRTINSIYEQRIDMLEERNRKLEKENETLNGKFMASSCIISDLNTKIKDLETDKISLVASIKLMQIHDNYYVDSCTSNKTTQIGDSPGSSRLDDSILNLCATNNENNNRQCSLKCKYKSKKHQTEESSMNQTSNSKPMPANADVLAVNNRFSILSDIDSQEDLLVINQGRPSGNGMIKFKIVVSKPIITKINKCKITVPKEMVLLLVVGLLIIQVN